MGFTRYHVYEAQKVPSIQMVEHRDLQPMGFKIETTAQCERTEERYGKREIVLTIN